MNFWVQSPMYKYVNASWVPRKIIIMISIDKSSSSSSSTSYSMESFNLNLHMHVHISHSVNIRTNERELGMERRNTNLRLHEQNEKCSRSACVETEWSRTKATKTQGYSTYCGFLRTNTHSHTHRRKDWNSAEMLSENALCLTWCTHTDTHMLLWKRWARVCIPKPATATVALP